MFCQNCGSPIPDGSKFCTECGAPAPVSEATATEPDYGNIDYPDYPNAGEPAPAEPARQTPAPTYQQPSAPSCEPRQAQAPSSGGWSIPGGSGASFSAPASPAQSSWDPDRTAAKKSVPVTKRWWFWLIIGLVIVGLLVAVVAALFTFTVRDTDEPAVTTAVSTTGGGIREGASSLTGAAQAKADAPTADEVEVADIPEIKAPEIEAPPADVPEADAGSATADEIAADFDRRLTEAGVSHEISVDEDDWITAYIWYDGVDELTDLAALDGDADALAQWNDDIEYMRQLSDDLGRALSENGYTDASGIVGIQDDIDYDIVLAYAFDGEVVYDWVNKIDLLGLEK